MDDVISIPAIAAYNDRDFQVTASPSDANPTGGVSIIYTITVANRTTSAKSLDEIKATIPNGFVYDCNGSADQLTLPGESSQTLYPDHRFHSWHFCVGDGDSSIKWDVPDDPNIEPGEEATLTYTVVTSATLGTYCTEVKAKPDEDHNRSGQTAIVQIGATPGLCPDKAMTVTKSWTSATLASTDTSTTPYTYTFNIDFEIKLDNIGSDSLAIDDLNDLLPLGFSYSSMDLSGDITNAPTSTDEEATTNREEIIWVFSPDVTVASGTNKTLKYTATASITRGNYWSDVITDFDGTDFPDDKYTWPTAMIAVRDVFLNTATMVGTGDTVANISLNVASDSGLVSVWELP